MLCCFVSQEISLWTQEFLQQEAMPKLYNCKEIRIMTFEYVLQRIMGVKYSFPTNLHISRECLDMMSKIFVGNPANRISIAGIKSHPWFTKNLPDELKVCFCMFGVRYKRHLLYHVDACS